MQNLSSQALVLKTSLLGESDLLVDLYSLELGKISAVAKGVKSRKSRWANRFSLFSQIQFEALKGSGFAKLIKAESLKSLAGLNAIDLALLSTIGEAAGQLVFPGQTNEQIYKLLVEIQAIFSSQKNFDRQALLLITWSKLLTILGFLAILTHCSGCRKKFSSSATWSANTGALCGDCKKVKSNRVLSFSEIKLLAFFQRACVEDSLKVELSSATKAKIYPLLKTELLSHLSYPVKSLPVFEELVDGGS